MPAAERQQLPFLAKAVRQGLPGVLAQGLPNYPREVIDAFVPGLSDPEAVELIRRYRRVWDGFDDRSVIDDFTRQLGPRLTRLLSEYLMRNSL